MPPIAGTDRRPWRKAPIMKLLVSLTCVVLLVAGCSSDDGGGASDDATATSSARTASTAGDAGGSGEVFEVDGDTTVQVAAGSTFTLSLEANATTGYRWAERVDGVAVRSDGGEYLAPGEGMPGQGGTQEYRYEAVAAGTATIELTYSQAGSGEVGQQYVVTVEVS